ncbi:MAG: hypothetical protein JEZ08_02980 [Clostridiales bacterium]|nr:hypothetical protein [Clostridiales bacterium]
MREYYKAKGTKHKRIMSLILSIILLVNMFVYIPDNIAIATAPEHNGAGYRYNKIEVSKVEGNGDLTPINDLTTKIEHDATVNLKFYWQVDNDKDLAANSTLTYTLPAIFNWGNNDASGRLEAPAGRLEDYGGWLLDVSENKLIITFNNKPNTESNVNGLVQFNVDLKFYEVTETLPYTWTVPISAIASKDIIFDVTPENGNDLTKTGARVGTTNDIKWTIDFNTKLESLTAPILNDEYSSLLNFNAASLTIKELTVDSIGNTTVIDSDVKDTVLSEVIAPVDAGIGVTDGLQGTVDFKFNTTSKAYRIEYVTTIDPAKININQTDFSYGNRIRINGKSFVTATPVDITRGSLITKSGELSEVFNASSIDWTIHVNNAGYSLTNARIEDTIPAGLDLTTVTVAKASAPNSPIVVTTTEPAENGLMTINLGDISEEYIIKYTTNILPAGKTGQNDVISFTNEAKLIHDLGTSVPIDGATTMAVKLGRVVYKKGSSSIDYNSAKYINWELYINTSEIDLGTDKTIIDAFGSDQFLDEAHGITIEELTVNKGGISGNDVDKNPTNITKRVTANANALPTMSTTLTGASGSVTGFEIEFTDSITKAYKISYRTIIQDYSKSNFTNTGTVGTHSYIGKATASIGNVYSKNRVGSGIDYLTNILDWQIVVNPIEHELDAFVINDDFPTDQLMTDAQFAAIAVTKDNAPFATTITKKVDDQGNADPSDDIIRGFKVEFPDDINLATFRIDYNTTIDPDVLSIGGNLDYSNTASFTWSGQVGDPLEKTAKPYINNLAKNNGQKWGELSSTNSKQIEWLVDVNYLSKNMKDFTVSDTIIGNQNLIPDSVKVYSASVNTGAATHTSSGNLIITNPKEGLTKGIEVLSGTNGVTIIEDIVNDKFTIDFAGDHVIPYRIEYKTEFEGVSQEKYHNEVVVSNGETYTYDVDYNAYDRFISKTGQLNDTTSIDWSVKVNESQSTIESITITDTLSKGLVLDQSSFAISEAGKEFNDYFTISIRNKALVTDPTVVDLISKQQITDTFTMTYTTTIEEDEVVGKSVNNNISFVGEKIDFGTRTATVTKSFASIQGFGTGTGEVGSFTLTKVDKDDNSIKLQGAEYELKRGNKILGTLTTDINGEITVNGLLYLDHTLTETKAPEGYKLDATPYEFTINSATKSFTLENEQLRTLRIKKVDAANESQVLQGAVFEIYDDGDVLVDTVTTDHTGYAEKVLDKGEYKIKEITAPSGYYLSNVEETAIIDTSGNSFEVIFKNNKIPRPSNPDPDPDPTPKPIPEPTPEPTPEPKPVPEPVPEEEPKEDKVVEKTTEDTPKGGEVEIPEGAKPKVEKPPVNGIVEVDDTGKWTYTPNPGFEGDDSFTIKVENPDGTDEIIYFEIEVEETPLGFVKLPQTGDNISWIHYIMGSILMLAGVTLFKSKK